MTRDVPPHGLIAGVPGRLVGYVCRCGTPLEPRDLEGPFRCPDCERRYRLVDGTLQSRSG